MSTLRQLYEQHQGKVTDKWSIYLSEYERLFAARRGQALRMLEIGIQNGGSLEVWGRYFSDALSIVGCDINPDCARLRYADPRITVVVGDANTDEVEHRIAAASAQFDLIIDDGSHRSGDMIRSFARYLPRLADGGLFVVEDVHCSYWQAFEGGLFDPASSMSFFKRLADVINHEHWGVPKARGDILASFAARYDFEIDDALLGHVHSIEFANSLCVIRKQALAENVLGERFIAGTDELVVDGHAGLHHARPVAPDESSNPWSVEEDELAATRAALTQLRSESTLRDAQQAREIASLNSTLQRSTVHAEQLQAHAQQQSTQLQTQRRQLQIAESQLPRFRAALEQALQQHVADALPVADPLSVPLWSRVRVGGVFAEPWRWLRRLNHARLARRRRFTMPAADYGAWVARHDTLDDAMRARMRRRVESMTELPLISVVMPTYNANSTWLRAAIESVRGQFYLNWELCIADDASTSDETRRLLQSYVGSDPRIKVVFRAENGHISAASNSALELATGDWVALMDHDDLLPEHALFWVADAIDRHPGIQLIYSDEDKVDEAGVRSGPYFKPDWNLDLFYSQNLFSHLGVYRTALIREVGGFRIGMEGSQDYDLVLRCLERVLPSQVHHVPKVLYHWRVHEQSTAHTNDAKPYAQLAGVRALNEHFSRLGVRGRIEHVGIGYRAHYELPANRPLVSLIVATSGAAASAAHCVETILARTTYDKIEIIVVCDGADGARLPESMQVMEAADVLRIVDSAAEFDIAASTNRAVALARGEVIGLLGSGVEVVSPTWLSEMVSLALQPGVGAVGAQLRTADGALHHGGVVLGLGGVAGRAHGGLRAGNHGYHGRAGLIQGLSAVSGDCLVVRKDRFDAVNGLNETALKTAFGDVDFCLRLREAGFRNVCTPYAQMRWHGDPLVSSAAPSPQDASYMEQRWGELLRFDPAYSPNLTLAAEDFGLAWPPREPADLKLD